MVPLLKCNGHGLSTTRMVCACRLLLLVAFVFGCVTAGLLVR